MEVLGSHQLASQQLCGVLLATWCSLTSKIAHSATTKKTQSAKQKQQKGGSMGPPGTSGCATAISTLTVAGTSYLLPQFVQLELSLPCYCLQKELDDGMEVLGSHQLASQQLCGVLLATWCSLTSKIAHSATTKKTQSAKQKQQKGGSMGPPGTSGCATAISTLTVAGTSYLLP